MHEARHRLGPLEGLTYAASNYEALEACDALLVVTEWPLFRNPDFERMKALMRAPVIFDGRNIYSPEVMRMLGFDYLAVGRAPVFAYSRT